MLTCKLHLQSCISCIFQYFLFSVENSGHPPSEFTSFQKVSSATICSKQGHFWPQARLTRAFPFRSWKPPGKEIEQTVPLNDFAHDNFFFLLMSNHKLLCFSLWFPISHPPAIWKDLFHLLNNLLLVHQMVGVVRDLWQPSDPNTD